MQTYWDWQVTTAYYAAVHLLNAHLAKTANIHYKVHEAVKNEINPESMSGNPACRIEMDIYLCYVKLEGLSRRSRYLCHQDKQVVSYDKHTTYDKHFAKSIKYLDKILEYFMNLHSFQITPSPQVSCPELTKQSQLKVFKLK